MTITCRLCHREHWTGFRVNRIKSGRRIVARSEAGRLCLSCARETANAINAERRRSAPATNAAAVGQTSENPT